MERLFQLVGQYCFQGHTHVPGHLHREFPVLFARGDRPGVHPGRREADDQRGLGGSAARRRQPCVLRALRGRPGRGRPATGRPNARRRPSRRRSPIVVSPTTSRRRSARSTRSPSSNRSWAIDSDRGDRLVRRTGEAGRLMRSPTGLSRCAVPPTSRLLSPGRRSGMRGLEAIDLARPRSGSMSRMRRDSQDRLSGNVRIGPRPRSRAAPVPGLPHHE